MNIVYVYGTKQFERLVKQINNNLYKPHDDVLILDPVDTIDFSIDIEEAFNIIPLFMHDFRYVCYKDKIIFGNNKVGDTCELTNVIKNLLRIDYINYIPSSTIIDLLKFIADKQNTSPDKIMTDLNITSTSDPIDKLNVITEALKYDTPYVLNVIIDGIKTVSNEIIQLVQSTLTRVNNKFQQ
jgi:hypothetical protein